MAEKEETDPKAQPKSESEDVGVNAQKVLDDLSEFLDPSFLGNFMRDRLHIDESGKKVLDEVSVEGVARYIKDNKCKNIITMAGAGISTSAGIPDFRSEGSGLYDNLQKYNLPCPEAIFTIDYFRENPKPFFVLAKELFPGTLTPTPCHYFIRMLHDKGLLLRHYTQNIDTLERISGLPDDKVVEAHGTFHTSHCLTCKKEYTMEWMKEKIFSDVVPECEETNCKGVVKPDIVFFGEALPKRFADCVGEDFEKCDLLIIMGTSLKVQPFASLSSRVSKDCPRLYINLQAADPAPAGFLAFLMPTSGFDFDSEKKYRDVFKQATCDDGCQQLAALIGWGTELKTLIKTETVKINKENGKSEKPEKVKAV
ncbi:hypothetical protein SNE40_010940 [Patella caerulea]|uniref:NAD-dependent protein deacetylase n=1 Tax=Patella caerulea TaxID=87958 RepID=A0AAN8PTB2_PATCE